LERFGLPETQVVPSRCRLTTSLLRRLWVRTSSG
jgi:hypothetical protein